MEAKKQKTEKPEVKAAFQPARLRTLGAGTWVYRHEGDRPESLPADFWTPAKQNYGMKDGDCVIFVSGKEAALVVA